MKTAISVKVKKRAVKAAMEAIVKIMQQARDEATVCAALDAFTKSTMINNTTIQNCHFEAK